MNSDIIHIENLAVAYYDKKILENINLFIPKNSFVAIIGLNGSGKSTFLKALSRKIEFAGNISLDENDFSHLGQKNNIQFNLSVQDILLMGRFRKLHFTQNYSEDDKLFIFELLKKIGYEKIWDKNFKEISGGEQQIVWILQTLLQEVSVFLLDEPTQQLDLLNKKKVFSLLESIVKEKNKTIFCVTHDIYNLRNIDGYLINFSKTKPILEKINDSSIAENIQFLEQL